MIIRPTEYSPVCDNCNMGKVYVFDICDDKNRIITKLCKKCVEELHHNIHAAGFGTGV